ncbi:hypothetical protein ACFT2C_07080 [Promicromonospora sp. NPDC057138]|uniref:hypothetical protein n=1 Tax=Promicromonospora sp. NPDC057138 TaxID=3346031 RepID=UPI00363AD92A
MKRKFVSRALPTAIVAGGLLVAGAMSASAAGESTSNLDQSTGSLGGLLTDTVDAVVGEDGAVDSTLNQVTDTVGQVTKEDGAVDDTVKGVTGVVDSVAGKDGAVDDVVSGVTGGASDASDDVVTTKAATPSANDGGPVEDVLGGVTGAVNAVAGENGAVDDVLGADGPEQGVTDNVASEIINDVGSIGENLGSGDVPGVIGGAAGEDGVVDDLLESPSYASNPGGEDPGDGGGDDGGSDDGGPDDGSDDGGVVPIGNDPGTGINPVAPIGADGEAQAPGALAETGGQVGGVVAAGLALTAAGAAMIRARRRMLEVQD